MKNSDTEYFHADMIHLFNKIGDRDIKKLMLNYFRNEMGDDSLRMTSSVFPKPTDHRLTIINKLAVRRCLYDNWAKIREIYPCLKAFKYIVGDLNFMHIIRFPYVDMKTNTIHGVETVEDFAQFTMDLVYKLCFPCMKSRNDVDFCGGEMEQKLKNALELCTNTKCADDKKKLLTYVTKNFENKVPSSAVKIQGIGVGSLMGMSSVIGSGGTTNLQYSQDSDGAGLFDALDNSFRRDVVGAMETTNPLYFFLKNESQLTNTGINIANSIHMFYGDKFDIKFHERKPESQEYLKSVDTMRKVKELGYTINNNFALSEIHSILKSVDHTIQVRINEENRIVFDWAIINNIGVNYTPEEILVIERVLSKIQKAIVEDGNVQLLGEIVRHDQLQKFPLDIEIAGNFNEDGDWEVKAVIYVIGDNVRLFDLETIKSGLSHNNTGEDVHMFFDNNDVDGVQVNDRKDAMAHFVGPANGVSDEEAMRRISNIMGTPYVLDSTADMDITVGASAIHNFIYGEAPKFDKTDKSIGAFFMTRSMVERDPDGLKELGQILTENMDVKNRLNNVQGVNAVDEVLQRVAISNGIDPNFSLVSGDTTNVIEKAPSRLRKEVIGKIKQTLARQVRPVLDVFALQNDPGYAEFMKNRDAIDNLKAMGGEATKNEREKVRKAVAAVNYAGLLRKTAGDILSWWGQLMRMAHHGNSSVRTLPFGVLSMYAYYNEVYEEVTDEDAQQVIQQNMEAIILEPMVDSVKDVSYRSLIGMVKDTTFAHEYLAPRSLFNMTFIKSYEMNAFYQTIAFLMALVAFSFITRDRVKAANEIEDEEKRMKKIKDIRHGKRMIIIASGLTVHVPILVTYLVIMVSTVAVEAIGATRHLPGLMKKYVMREKGNSVEPGSTSDINDALSAFANDIKRSQDANRGRNNDARKRGEEVAKARWRRVNEDHPAKFVQSDPRRSGLPRDKPAESARGYPRRSGFPRDKPAESARGHPRR